MPEKEVPYWKPKPKLIQNERRTREQIYKEKASFVAFENLNFNYLKIIEGGLPACDFELTKRICSKLCWSTQIYTV
jgi:hypothetical protein